jgi:hypothetical protein
MFPRLFCLLVLAALLIGCAKEEEDPYVESIPPIPPGRASSSPDGGAPGYQPPAPPPAPPSRE